MAVAHPVMAGSFLASSFMASWDRRVVASRASMAIVLLGLSQLTGGLQGLPHSSFTPCTRTIIRHEPSEVYQDSKPKLHWKIPTKFNCWPVNRICVTTDRLPGSRRDGARPFLLSCLSYCRDKRPPSLSFRRPFQILWVFPLNLSPPSLIYFRNHSTQKDLPLPSMCLCAFPRVSLPFGSLSPVYVIFISFTKCASKTRIWTKEIRFGH